MKKTLLATLQFPPAIGGVETHLYNIAKRLDPAKLLVFANEHEGGENFDQPQRYQTIRTKFFYPYPWVWPQWLPLLKKMRQLVPANQIEHILAGQVLPVGTAAMITAQTYNIDYSVYTYGMDIEVAKQHRRHRRTLKQVLDHATRIFTISADTQRRIQEIGIPEKKIIKITPGLDIAEFLPPAEVLARQTEELRQRHSLHDKKVILTIGRLVARKGQDTVIRALPIILKDEPLAHYVIAGGGEYEKSLKTLVQQLNLSKHVTFTGQFAETDKAAWYNLCDVFVMISRIEKQTDIEGFGIVYLEANALGKPVVAGQSGGVAEAVMGSQTGLLVQDPTDPLETAQTILKILRNPELGQRLGQQGFKRVERDFNWDKIVSGLDRHLAS